MRIWNLLFILLSVVFQIEASEPPLFYESGVKNFGDELSRLIVNRIVDRSYPTTNNRQLRAQKFLCLGSIIHYARDGDLIWGAGINGKHPSKSDYSFCSLDVRAVRGPLTRRFLQENFNINCPKVYGDPALLVPILFPEHARKAKPKYPCIVIPHLGDLPYLPPLPGVKVVLPNRPVEEIIEAILDSELVISSALHGIIVAEAFGVPARLLRLSPGEPIFKYADYYHATGRKAFGVAFTLSEAIEMGGEEPLNWDPEPFIQSFPQELL